MTLKPVWNLRKPGPMCGTWPHPYDFLHIAELCTSQWKISILFFNDNSSKCVEKDVHRKPTTKEALLSCTTININVLYQYAKYDHCHSSQFTDDHTVCKVAVGFPNIHILLAVYMNKKGHSISVGPEYIALLPVT